MRKTIVILLVFMFFMVSCVSPAVPPTETPVPSPTLTPTLTLTSTPSPTATITLTSTPLIPSAITDGMKNGWTERKENGVKIVNNPKTGLDMYQSKDGKNWEAIGHTREIVVGGKTYTETTISDFKSDVEPKYAFKFVNSRGLYPQDGYDVAIVGFGTFKEIKTVEISNNLAKSTFKYITLEYIHEDGSLIQVEFSEPEFFFKKYGYYSEGALESVLKGSSKIGEWLNSPKLTRPI